jgi:uncharacterized protein YidB (DUF937 family)
VLGGGDKQQLVAQIATTLITNHSSGQGLTGLVQQLEQAGLGSAVQSWVGNGQNQTVSGEQVHQALGPELIQQLSQQTGLQGSELGTVLAQALPLIINHATPNGVVPPQNEVQGLLGNLLGRL